MRLFIGDAGHYLVILSFVFSIISAFSYFLSTKQEELASAKDWRNFARISFFIHGLSVIGVVVCLFIIIQNHYYEYHYAWSHSSDFLPTHFMISCFWEGQEGSFLLWIFWHVILGTILIFTSKKWEAHVMTIFVAVQIFLTSMIIGVVFLDIKIGSSPFILLREALYNAPIFQANPGFVPEDGTGLNPLLQNYWMVIHPPTLFLGFAGTLVPFAYAIAALWRKEYTSWIKPVLPWTLATAMVLGVGILMGAYWAYETLNFGGYWNWDPVENAVYVPWLVLIAGLHGMTLYQSKKVGLKLSFILVCTSFLLILYSTFLTRSGILGEASVHSFTDLGLSGQLLVYLLFFVVIATVILIIRWKEIPEKESKSTIYSTELWIFLGVSVLLIASFQVIMATSIPVFNTIKGLFGEKGKLAPPSDQVLFYSKFQLWAGVFIALLGGIGQYVWWNKFDSASFKKVIRNFLLVIVSLLIFSIAIIVLLDSSYQRFDLLAAELQDQQSLKPLFSYIVWAFGYILLLAFAMFSAFTSARILQQKLIKDPKLSGGAIAHISVALMLIGILFSSGYSKITSVNRSGLLYSKEFPEQMNLENVLLWRKKPLDMPPYRLVYQGPLIKKKGEDEFLKKDLLALDEKRHRAFVTSELKTKESVYATGDTVSIDPENTYYEVDYYDESGEKFTLYPRAQANPSMGLLASPDVKHLITKDLYTFIASIPDPTQEVKWHDESMIELSLGDTTYMNDFVVRLDSVQQVSSLPMTTIKQDDIAIQATFSVFTESELLNMKPVLIIGGNQAKASEETLMDAGIRLSFVGFNNETQKFKFAVQTSQRDYIILKVMEKPLINFLWFGCILMAIGFCISIYRRVKEL